MAKLYQSQEQREEARQWVISERTGKEMAKKYAISNTVICNIRNNIDGEYTSVMVQRVQHAIREWKRQKSGQPEPEQIDLPGMPPTRRSILLELIQKEIDAAGDDKLERIYKAIVTA